jgi:hypothetical protein
VLTSKGYYPATFRSLFGDVPVRVRRLLVCPGQGSKEAKSFAVLDLALVQTGVVFIAVIFLLRVTRRYSGDPA